VKAGQLLALLCSRARADILTSHSRSWCFWWDWPGMPFPLINSNSDVDPADGGSNGLAAFSPPENKSSC